MVRTIRFFAGVAFLASALFAGSGTGPMAFAADKKKEDKKLEMPKLPEGSNPKWDFEAVEEKFTIVKGTVNENGKISFLLELKEDLASTPSYEVVFTDSCGVKFYKTNANCFPNKGKKGDRVRLNFTSAEPATSKDTWVKAVKVQFVAD